MGARSSVEGEIQNFDGRGTNVEIPSRPRRSKRNLAPNASAKLGLERKKSLFERG